MPEEIKNYVLSREASLLFHFTPLENLDSIIQNGIMPRDSLAAKKIPYKFNDNYRIDGQQNASCFSIEWPNYKMFHKLKMENKSQEWVVLTIHRQVLWTKHCAFFCGNAASTEEITTPLNAKLGLKALQKIFEPVVGKPPREELKLHKKFPTNPQAEVLIYDVIEPSNIINILCPNSAMKEKLLPKYPNQRVLFHEPYFGPRIDWKVWKK